MFKTYRALPEGYALKRSIDMQQNKWEMLLLNIGSLLLFIVVGTLWTLFISPLAGDFVMLFLFFILAIVNIIVHEFIHAIFFKLGETKKVRFKFHGFAASASVPDHLFQKHHYIIIGLAPFIILGVVYALFAIGSALFLPSWWLTLAGLIMALHISGCIGDFYVTLLLLRYPKDTLIKDYGIGMHFYTNT